jgi:DNA mismatch repair protein MutL
MPAGTIRVLPGEVVSRIAAGEVVERPAAVVRELIDNSLDAGSRRIQVDVTDGGRRLIRVVDDGEGMNRHDAPLAFQRHATSKLRTEADLASIATLGFRGEALPSIASVSKIRLVSACRGQRGTELVLDAGRIVKVEDAAAERGTQIDVSDLFFNTPARKKFLKATATEFSHISQVVQHAGMAWPSVQFSLRHNGKDVLAYPSAATVRDRVFQVYGARFLERVAEIEGDGPGVKVHGFVAQPVRTGPSRTPQDLFVNRRPVRNATVLHAVYDAYDSYLPKGHHPVFVLFLEIDPQLVDVNVHPTKREVRFADQDRVHQVVRRAIRAVFSEMEGAPLSAPLVASSPAPAAAWPRPAGGFALSDPGPAPETVLTRGETVRESARLYGADLKDVTPFGQVGGTFLVAQVGSELHVIDQHTAHERVLFERLWRGWQASTTPVQPLLLPMPLDLPPHQAVLLERHLSDLAGLGLEVEPFGQDAFVIRSLPMLLGQVDPGALIQDLLEDLGQWDTASSLENKVRAVLASLACHGAVRAGRVLDLPEIKRLIEDWVAEGLPSTCPHGRRVAMRLSEAELAKIFGRA